jgi:hypothetical protein
VIAAPWRAQLDDWLRSMELLAELAELEPGSGGRPGAAVPRDPGSA